MWQHESKRWEEEADEEEEEGWTGCGRARHSLATPGTTRALAAALSKHLGTSVGRWFFELGQGLQMRLECGTVTRNTS